MCMYIGTVTLATYLRKKCHTKQVVTSRKKYNSVHIRQVLNTYTNKIVTKNTIAIKNSSMANKQRIPKWQSKMDNLEKLAT